MSSKVRFTKPLANAGGLLLDRWTDHKFFVEYLDQEAHADKVRIDTDCQEVGIASSSEMYVQLAFGLARETYQLMAEGRLDADRVGEELLVIRIGWY